MYLNQSVTPVMGREVLQIAPDEVGKLVYGLQLPSHETRAALEILMVLAEYDRQITVLKKAIRALEKQPLCCGSLERRDNGAMLVVHGVRDKCPFPGHEPKPEQRRGPRRYVRQEDRKMIIKAQSRFVERQRLQRELEMVERGRRLVADKLRVGHETAVSAVR